MSSSEIRGKVAVVTGGTRGIGLAIAEALVAAGASAFICGRDEGRVRAAIGRLGPLGSGQADGIVADVRRPEDCRRLVLSAVERFGGIDILVNNAGIGILKRVEDLTPEEWRDVIDTNLSAVFHACREAIPHLRRRGGGHIINVSSLAGVNAFPEGAAYNASKFGLNGFSEALMQEVRDDGIRVSCILPGSVDTDFRFAPGTKAREAWKLAAEDVAEAVVDILRYPSRAIASRIDLRPSRPPRKGG